MSVRAYRVFHIPPALTALALSCAIVLPLQAQAQAQDSAFLACARFADRGQRIACLEDALEAAARAGRVDMATEAAPPTRTPARPAPASTPEPASTPATQQARATDSTPASPSRAEPEAADAADTDDDPGFFERLRNFGRSDEDNASTQNDGPRIATDDSGNEELRDTIAALEQRRGMWIVTLSSGQIWRQQVPRRLNLREGDAVRIYREGVGNGYRLAAEHLSGFIRVERAD